MNTIRFLLILLCSLTLSSCQPSSQPLYIQYEYTPLNTVVAPWQKDNDLLPWVRQGHIMIINSVDDVYSTQTEKFIGENPNWLNVDFSTKSIIALRTIMFDYSRWVQCNATSFSKYIGDNDNFLTNGDYVMNVQENYRQFNDVEDENLYRIYQIAIITDKIPTDAHVIASISTNIKAGDIWD